MNERIPRAVTPLFHEYMAVAHILYVFGDLFYNMTEREFTACIMEKTNGFFNPARAKVIYRELMDEAGLEPLYDEVK